MSINPSGTNSGLSWLGIFAIAAIAAFVVVWQFFPQIMQQAGAGIVAFFAFLVGLVFRKKRKSGS